MTLVASKPSTVLLQKAGEDTGFDVPPVATGDWLHLRSTQAPLGVWLRPEFGGITVAMSMGNVAAGVAEYGPNASGPLPVGAVAARVVPDLQTLHRCLGRAYRLSRTLPNAMLDAYAQATKTLPMATEAERLVVTRVGQDIFRKGLLEYWDRRCAMTGLAQVELLRASHIKPWAACTTDAERLDVFNGLLLAPHLDALFDLGFITVLDSGVVEVSAALTPADRVLLGLPKELRVDGLADGHRKYLPWHREKVFKSGAAG